MYISAYFPVSLSIYVRVYVNQYLKILIIILYLNSQKTDFINHKIANKIKMYFYDRHIFIMQ